MSSQGQGKEPASAATALLLPHPLCGLRIQVQEPLPLDNGPGKLQGQELKSRLSCPNPPFSPPHHPSSSSSPSSSALPLSTPTVSPSTSNRTPDGLLYIRETLSRRLFLVDMCATISVFPHPSSASAATSLCAAGGQPIANWGKHTIPLSFSPTSSRTHYWFDWNFMLAAVNRPILGANFLQHHQFDVSIAQYLLVPCCCPPPCLQYCSPRCPSSTRRFWQDFPRLLALVSCPALSSMMSATTSVVSKLR